MPLSFTGIDPAQATALTSLARRQQQTLVPQFAYQRALMDASKQQALAALALNKQQILNQRALTTGQEKTQLNTQAVQRNALEALNQYRMGVANAMSQQGTATNMDQAFREMRLRNIYGAYSLSDQQSAQDLAGVNQTLANVSSTAGSLYQAQQQRKYAQDMINYINGSNSQTYPTWQYTKTTG